MKRISCTLLLITCLIGCTPFKIAVSDELKSDHDEYTVQGRQGILIKEKLSFGEYNTTKVKRSWTKGSSFRNGIGWGGTAQYEWVNIISTEYINRRQTVNFSMSDGANSSEVFCVSRFNSKDLQIGRRETSILNIGMDIAGIGDRSSSLYYVQVFINNDEDPWQLVLDNQAAQAKSKSYIGILAKSKKEYYTLIPITKLEKNGKTGSILGGSVGFEFQNEQGTAIAAVSLIDKGMVFLSRTSKEERFLLANTCAALLLQQNIED
jgi:hypothetical protein